MSDVLHHIKLPGDAGFREIVDEQAREDIAADALRITGLANSKQDNIADLDTIRSGAALGATALQTHQDISGKQDVISDLQNIRSGAALGATALQTHQDISGKQNVIPDLQTIRAGAALGATALQSHQDISGKQDKINDLASIRSGAQLASDNIGNINDRLDGIDTSLTQIVEDLDDKQDALTAGPGIVIEGSTISSNAGQQIVSLKDNIATVSNKVETLEDASEGRLYTSTATSGSGTQTVPADALCRAIVKEYDGKTVVQDGALVSADVSTVKSVGKNRLNLMGEWKNDGQYQELPIDIGIGNYVLSMERNLCNSRDNPFTTDYVFCINKRGLTTSFTTNPVCYFGHTGNPNYDPFSRTKYSFATTEPVSLYVYFGVRPKPDNYLEIIDTLFGSMQIEAGIEKTAYSPYIGENHTIPSSVRTSYPLRSAGDVHDSISWDGSKWWHTKKVGVVDLSTINWNYASGGGFWYSSKPDMKINGSINTALYRTISTDINSSTPSGVVSTKYSSYARIDVKNGSSDDKPTGSANYELATPVVTDITSLMAWDASIAVEAGGTVEFSNQQLLSVPNVVEYKVGKTVVTQTQLNEAIATLGNSKQDVLTAGENISIVNNVISATGGSTEREWVMKGTLTDPASRLTLTDMDGYTQLYVFSVVTATNNANLYCQCGGGTTFINTIAANGTRKTMSLFVDSIKGFVPIYSYYGTTNYLADKLTAACQLNKKISDIVSLYISHPDRVTSCSIEVYAR